MADSWKTQADVERLEKYSDGVTLFKGRHHEFFYDLGNSQHLFPTKVSGEIIYVAANYFGLASKKFADMMFLDPVRISLPDGATKQEKAINRILRDSTAAILNHTLAMAGSYKGDTGYRIIRDAKGIVRLRGLRADQYFPVLNPDDIDDVQAIERKWVVSIGDDRYLRVERHAPGVITNAAFRLDDNAENIEAELSDRQFADLFPDVEREIKSGIDQLLIEHIPNFKTDEEHFGQSDYEDLSIQSQADELNNRLSQISRILDIHSDPKMKGPADLEDSRGNVSVSGSMYFGVAAGEESPAYITWDAQLEANLKQTEKILLILCNMMEVAPEIIGWRIGSDAEATDTLRIRCANTIAKVNRKLLYFDPSLRRTLATACEFAGGGAMDPDDITITWSDGLPIIESEVIRQETEKLNAGLTSRLRAIMRVNNCDEERAKAILDEIEEEESRSLPTTFGGGGGLGLTGLTGLTGPTGPTGQTEDEE